MPKTRAVDDSLDTLESAGLEGLEELCTRERELHGELYCERRRVLAALGFDTPLAVGDLHFNMRLFECSPSLEKPRIILAGGREHFCLLVPGRSDSSKKEQWLASQASHAKSELVRRAYFGEIFEIRPHPSSNVDFAVHLSPPTELAKRVRQLLKFWSGPRTFY